MITTRSEVARTDISVTPDVELNLPGITARLTGSLGGESPMEVWTVVAVSDNQFRFGLHPLIEVHASRDEVLRALRFRYAETLSDYGCDWQNDDDAKVFEVLTKVGVRVFVDRHDVRPVR